MIICVNNVIPGTNLSVKLDVFKRAACLQAVPGQKMDKKKAFFSLGYK